MNADILKRIMRAIADGSQNDLDVLAEKVVESERESGHTKLANDLAGILRRGKRKTNGTHAPAEVDQTFRELPQSRRTREALVSVVPHDTLEHHMVLPTEVDERFARIEREYAARERLGAYGLRPRKTILLYGPPGCGKSLGAKRLAWNTGLSLMKVRFDALLSSFFGESAANLRSVFDAAKERPCLLLLDECDFIARSRGNSKDVGEASRIVNALLQLMEEFDAPGLLVATTNLENALDEAIFRRFDDVFLVPLPGLIEIERLLRFTLSSVTVSKSVRWETAIASLFGQPAAQVVKAAQDAAKAAVLGGVKVIEDSHLRTSIADLKRESRSGPSESP